MRIPAGVEDGSHLRVPGRGGAGSGDLHLTIRVLPDSRFERRDRDLYVEVSVSIAEAALGAEIPVPTPDGDARIRISPGTPSGRKLRLAGRGVSRAKGGRGDLYASIRIVPPPQPSPEERELFEQLARVSRFDPRSTD